MWGGKEVEFDLKKRYQIHVQKIQNDNKKERFMFRSYVFRVGHLKITTVFNSDTGNLDTPYNGKRRTSQRTPLLGR